MKISLGKLGNFVKRTEEYHGLYVLLFMIFFSLVIVFVVNFQGKKEGTGDSFDDQNASDEGPLSVLQNTDTVELTPVRVTSGSTSAGSSDSGDVLGILSDVSPYCGGTTIGGVPYVCSRQEEKVNMTGHASLDPDVGMYYGSRDCPVEVVSVTIPEHWAGLADNDGNPYNISMTKACEYSDINKDLGGGGNVYAKWNAEESVFEYDAQGNNFGDHLLTPDLVPTMGVSTKGISPYEFHMYAQAVGEDVEGPTEGGDATVKAATPGCEGTNLGTINTGCPNPWGQLAENAPKDKVVTLLNPPMGDFPYARVNTEDQECIVPVAVVEGRTVCMNWFEKLFGGISYTFKKIFSPESYEDCSEKGSCKASYQVVINIMNPFGFNQEAPPKSLDMAHDTLVALGTPPSDEFLRSVYADGTVPEILPNMPDFPVASECTARVCGKLIDTYCVWWSSDWYKHQEELLESPPCNVEEDPCCDPNYYLKQVWGADVAI
ncbi:hypothetical protein JW710_03105 [Candidatus Dojkabacteria bacterium]|nr:hypothetical protein [Candidatus Dojkabacteria bacterium]